MILKAESISRKYPRLSANSNFFYAVKATDFEIKEGEVIAIMGRSGSGKTTFLNMLGGLLTPSEGKVTLDGTDIYSLSDNERSKLINSNIGIVPQGQSGIDSLTVTENILLPYCLYHKDNEADKYAKELIKFVGIEDIADCYPSQMSGGELRRMAIARALINRPGIILADEPTGDLDDESTRSVLELFRRLAQDKVAVLMVTHDELAGNYADCIYKMDAGTLTG
ncbi:MAG: ABC transporter ATP-binding protein [Clostridiales bacterium]|nr:ABC transporter ATP-binding protein [Clostridiales bacterium]